jgi:nucleoside phosphorylase
VTGTTNAPPGSFVGSATPEAAELIDFLIVTILDIEFEAVRRHLSGLVPQAHRDDPIVYLRATLPFTHGGASESYSIVLIQLHGMGNPGAAVAVATALRRFAPQTTIVVGIAGAVSGELKLGDVAVSRDLVYYEYGKQRETGLEHRASPVLAHSVLWNIAKYFAESDWHAKITATRPGSIPAAGVPQVKVGTIGSGEKVVVSASFIAELKQEYKNLIAVAMEGIGTATAATYFGARAGDILEIRGISDLADGTKTDDWQPFAADVAAAFMVAFLATGPISSREARAKPRTASRPFTAVRVQSMAPVNPDDVVQPLRSAGATAVHDAVVDLLPFSKMGGKLHDPAGAVRFLAAVDGPFMRALGTGAHEHLAFYGHVHVPLAMLAGALATDRLPIRLLEFHRNADPPGWAWDETTEGVNPPLETTVDSDENGLPEDAVIRVSLSYPVGADQTAAVIPRPGHAYNLRVASPVIDVVASESQTRAYAAEVRKAFDALSALKPRPARIHLFYAGPVSVAFAIGQGISPTIHPPVVAWNYRAGTYDWGLNLTRALDGEDAVVAPHAFRSEGG